MGYSFPKSVFRYSPLVPSGGRASRSVTLTDFSLSHVLVALTILFVATAGFFLGRLSLTDHDRSIVHRGFDLIPKCPDESSY